MRRELGGDFFLAAKTSFTQLLLGHGSAVRFRLGDIVATEALSCRETLG
jgi:hypothetical protein